MAEEGTPVDPTRGHQNNLEHARQVYLSVLFAVPKELAVSELAKLLVLVKNHMEDAP